ncbi:MAG: threonine--tRNA ligase [Dehalococcoidia bacterium]
MESKDERLHRMRHSASHVMAQAVLSLFPEAKFAIGPAIENGFYYDFDLPRSLTPEDLAVIEERMSESVGADVPFEREEASKAEARHLFAAQPYKLELIDDIEGETVSIYRHDGFVDLCAGPHVERTGEVKAFKLTSVAGAYWRGDEHRPMLQRIYGALFETQTELDDYLRRLEEAQQRDHRRLGREMELFMSSSLVGAGLPLWLPKGATIRRVLEEWITREERQAGYLHVYTPDIAKRELYEKSGHWEHYQELMFPPMKLEHEEMVLRPMNCPHHIIIYQSKMRSYRDLPVRIAELGTMYRFEKSGVMGGLTRVRVMTLNDAHIFCRPDQIGSEFAGVVSLMEKAYRVLGISEYSYRLSLRDPGDKEKYVDNDAMWDLGEQKLREAMNDLGLPYVEAAGEAAFYGPKVDVQIRDALGREETLSTIQLDFHLPERFSLTYIGEDGREHQPVMIHRGVISTMERMTAYLIEQYAGAFPTWLAPMQAVVVPIADRHVEYGQQVAETLKQADLRVEVDDRNERMNAKIRDAQLQKVPYMLVVGDREAEAGAVNVRLRSGENLGAMPVDELLARLQREVAEKT